MNEHLDSNYLGKALKGDWDARAYVQCHILKCPECMGKVKKMTKEDWVKAGGLEGVMNGAAVVPDLSAKSDMCLTENQIADIVYDDERMKKIDDRINHDEKSRDISDETLSHIMGCDYCKPIFSCYRYAKNIIEVAKLEGKMTTEECKDIIVLVHNAFGKSKNNPRKSL